MSIFANTVTAIAARLLAARHPRVPDSPSFTVRAHHETIAFSPTATGAFHAIQAIPAADRGTTAIYDENGYCMYR